MLSPSYAHSPREIQNYLNRVSDPLLDRIDIHVEVPAAKFREITAELTSETSAQIRERGVAARRRQQERFGGKRSIACNARMTTRELENFCALDEATLELLKMAMNELKFSARAYDRILKAARTIADLAASEKLTSEHISEAIQYRSPDRQLWAGRGSDWPSRSMTLLFVPHWTSGSSEPHLET